MQYGVPGAGAVSVPEFPEHQGRQMGGARAGGHGGGRVRLCPHLAGDSDVLLSDAGFPREVRERGPAAVLAAHEGEQGAPLPAGAELPASDAAVRLKLRHRLPVAGALHADDLCQFLPGSDESQGGVNLNARYQA